MNKHIHRLDLLWSKNSVRCIDFDCDHAVTLEDAMKKYFPEGLEVTPDHDDENFPVTQYEVRVAGDLWCILTHLKDGVMTIDRFRGSISEFVAFRKAIHDALGIYAIKDDQHLYVYSPISPVKVKKEKHNV